MRRRARFLPLPLIIALSLAVPPPAHAANAAGKLVRGAANTATGWLELPVRVVRSKRDGTAVLWIVTGLFDGVTWGLTRTLYGIYDIVSFPIPPYGGPTLDPETLFTDKLSNRSAN